MKILLTVLLISCIESSFSFNLQLIPLKTTHNTPVHYAMLKDLSNKVHFNNKYNLLELETLIGREMEHLLAMSKTRPADDNVSFNLDIIDNILNKDYEFMNEIQLAIEDNMPEIRNVMKVSPRGYICNQKFCDQFGDGHHAMGICTPYSCMCSIFSTETMKCKHGLYYDPILKICKKPRQIKICGI